MSKITVKDTSQIAQDFSKQIETVKVLIGDNCDSDEIKKTAINNFLSGKDVAGIGQGRFTKDVIKKINQFWDISVKAQCKEVANNSDDKKLFDTIKNLQKELIGYCEECGSKSKNGKPIVPWAAIHAMVAVLRPQDFCTIVTENNLDNLYKLLADYYGEGTDVNASVDEAEPTVTPEVEPEVEPTVDPEVEPEKVEDDDESQAELESEQANGVAQSENEGDNKSTTETEIELDNAKADWEEVDKVWKKAKKPSKGNNNAENMSWYIKSQAMHDFFKKLKGDNYWTKQSYAWETLIALRGYERIKTLAKKLVNKKQYNIILTGAPGTGKTYLARQIAARIIGCKVEALKEDKYKEKFEFVQFHPSYDYTDFVEGLRPYESKDASGQTTITFKREDGIFKRFCAKAAEAVKAAKAAKDNKDNKENKYVFFIDEINRGEISKIFGELFFSIDPGYRLKENRIPVRTQYQNLIQQDGNDPFKNGFYVPENVYIIGTMNDIDRSVESMDFAFRRRFAFIEVTADDSENMLLTDEEIKDRPTLVDKMHNLNAAILKCGLTSQYQIGGAYFKKIKDVKNYTELWNEYLKGTLYEYFRGEPETEITKKMELLKEAYDKGNGEE